MKESVTNKIFAAKQMKSRMGEQKSKALVEVLILQKLSDPHIIISFDIAYETPGEVIFIMEYLDGGELLEKVADEEFTCRLMYISQANIFRYSKYIQSPQP